MLSLFYEHKNRSEHLSDNNTTSISKNPVENTIVKQNDEIKHKKRMCKIQRIYVSTINSCTGL